MKIIHNSRPSEALLRLGDLVGCLGIAAEYADVADLGSFMRALEESEGDRGIVLDVASLSKVYEQDELERIATILRSCDVTALLVVTGVNEAANQFLESLTNGAVRGCEVLGAASRVSFSAKPANLIGELASYSYPRKHGQALALTVGFQTYPEILMKVDEAPSFLRVRVGSTTVFVWSTLCIFDVNQALSAEKEFEDAVDKYVPAIIFLRLAFRDQCWRNPFAGAGIIIDDPLLKKRYGFIKFSELLESARRHQYHVTLAFIPWNYWRSRAKEVRMFLDYSDCFSVCVHGCDHTNREFRSTDYEALLGKNFIARQRMEQLRQRTGLAHTALMVCPQEQYSLEAMRAFADSRQFIGLVCTACMPRNLASPQLRGADLLLPAQDSFFGFPVFKRHYWRDMSVFAMALFLGKPAILVEHHEFFRDGPAKAETFASGLAKLRPDMKWTSLVKTVTSTHLRRRLATNKYEVRFFTDTFRFEHTPVASAAYRLTRRVAASTLVQRVTVNGVEIPFTREDGFLAFELQADRPQTFSIQIDVTSVKPTKVYPSGITYQTSVALRRGLSELRDNVIARNGFALEASRWLIKRLKASGG